MYFQKFFIAVLLVIIIFANYALAEDKEVPLNLQVKNLFTALEYDKNFSTRMEDTLIIGILYFPEEPNSRREALELYKVLKAYKSEPLVNLQMSAFLFSCGSISSLESIISIDKIDLLYISSGRKNIIRNMTKVTQSKKVFSFTSHPEYVSECGVSMAVGYKDHNPKIYLNLSSAKAEGADFNAKFLRIANIVEEKGKR
jgi:hypothetical protein